VIDGVVHYCVANIPGAVSRTSTQALCNATLPYVRKLAQLGADEFAKIDQGHAEAINIKDGKIVNAVVAEVFGDLAASESLHQHNR
jgi:alanine dehydrogenase